MDLNELMHGTELLKRGFAAMQKGGVIMDVTTPAEAVIAEQAGAVAVMAKARIGHTTEAAKMRDRVVAGVRGM